MLTPILATKLRVPPPRPNAVPRPRLMDRLDDTLRSRLTLVSAPAGFGKTAVVSEWAAGCSHLEPEIRVAWLTLDKGDGDPASFITCLVAALRTVAPDIGQAVIDALASPQPPPIESILTALLNECAALPHEAALVLDDYHLVDSGPVDEALAFLLEHSPPQLHLLIATREDPRLPLARWRARGQLTELRAAELRFNPEEAAEFLNRVMGLNLSAENVSALEARTEGWIAGLQLAALSIRGRADAAGFIRAFTGSDRFVLDYLVEEVLRALPEDVRSFLLQTAILDKLCGALCDAVTGQTHGSTALERLERGNLFVVPLDDTRDWYRYHHLFADVLQAHLLAEQPDRLPTLHRRASGWYEENGSRPDAIRHALAAHDFERAADLIELEGPLVVTASQTAVWLEWARSLPDDLIRVRPVLSVWHAYNLLGRGAIEAAEARLKDAERWLEPGVESPTVSVDEGELRSLLATIAVARAYRAHTLGDVAGTVKHAQRVLELLPDADHPRRQQAIGLMGMTYWASGDLEATDRLFVDYSQRMLVGGNIPDAIGTMTVLPDIRPALGRLRGAVDALTQLLRIVEDAGPLPPEAADLYRGLGELALEQGDLASAAAHLLRSKELGRQGEMPVWRWRWHVAQARFLEATGDLEGALRLLEEAEHLFIRTPLPDVRPFAALRAGILVAQGRLGEALDWARDRGLSVQDELTYLNEFEHVTFAKVLILQGQREGTASAVDQALALLERLLQAAEQGHRTGSAIEILSLQALARQARGDQRQAMASLERALALAEPEGFVRVFVAEGPSMARLLTVAASRGMAPDTVSRLLAAFPPYRSGASRASQTGCADDELLSKREAEVLRYIAAGLGNREIADRLFLSLHTVKAHARSIYDKLDAHSRTQAVAKARELGILPLL